MKLEKPREAHFVRFQSKLLEKPSVRVRELWLRRSRRKHRKHLGRADMRDGFPAAVAAVAAAAGAAVVAVWWRGRRPRRVFISGVMRGATPSRVPVWDLPRTTHYNDTDWINRYAATLSAYVDSIGINIGAFSMVQFLNVF